MRQLLRLWFCFAFCLLVAGPALAQDEPPVVKNPPSNAATYAQESSFKAFIKDFFSDWLVIVGIVALLTLVGVLIYVKKKQNEDD